MGDKESMKYKVAICDDDKEFLDKINKILMEHLFSIEADYEILTFDNEELLLERCEQEMVQIFFLDVEMPPQNGIELAKTIRKKYNKNAYIVFISNYPEYMSESFEVHPYYYLTKQCGKEAIIHIMDEIFSEINDKYAVCNFELTDGIQENVCVRDILYMSVENSKKEIIAVHLINGKIHIRGKLCKWEKQLCSYGFIVCYKGILVNMLHIYYFYGNEIIMDNGEKLPVSRINEKIIKKTYVGKITEIL